MDDVKVIEYSCPHCSAELTFDIPTQKLVCKYCDSSFTREEIEKELPKNTFPAIDKAEEERLASEQKQFADENSVFNCPNCGATVITSNSNTASSVCHYCHTPVILVGRLSGEHRPDYIIPFKNTRNDAIEAFVKRTKRKMFLPRDFKSKATLSYINALYVPFWLADCKMDVTATAQCEKVTRIGNTKHITVYSCYRRALVDFDMVPFDGSARIDDALMQSIEPYNYSELTNFSMSYLSGIDAEKYDVSKEKIFPLVHQSLVGASSDYITQSLKKSFTNVRITQADGRISDLRWKYALLPVWFMNYTYQNKDYTYVMNGQTGKFSGILPINKLKLFLFSLLWFFIMIGATVLVTYLANYLGVFE